MWRPRVEVPDFKRCCLCVPLRYGLLAMAYTKLVIISCFSVMLTISLYWEFTFISHHQRTRYYLIVPSLLAIASYVDIGFTVVFIFAGHMKQRRGVLVYYYYTITITVLYVVATVIVMIIDISYVFGRLSYLWIYYAQDMLIVLCVTLVQIYLVLLLRSEYRKLSNPTPIRFANSSGRPDKSDSHGILEEQDDTESRIEEIGMH